MNLRWIKREGKEVLQYHDSTIINGMQSGLMTPGSKTHFQESREEIWQDIPTVPEKQEEKKLREFWLYKVNYMQDGSFYPCKQSHVVFNKDWEEIHVTELPPGSRVVSRDDLNQAIRTAGFLSHDEWFKHLCKLLGLEDDK